MAWNVEAGATRTCVTAVDLQIIEGKSRTLGKTVLRQIDLTLSRLPFYRKLELTPYLKNLQCWERRRVLVDMARGMPSGTIMKWSWMPGGSRAGIAAHVIWRVITIFFTVVGHSI